MHFPSSLRPIQLNLQESISGSGSIAFFSLILFSDSGKIYLTLFMHAKSLQSCPTLCNPVHCSPLGFSVYGFSRQEYWSGLPCPPPGDLLDTGIETTSPAALALQTDSLPLSHQGHTILDIKDIHTVDGGSDSKESACNTGYLGSIPG